MSYHGLGSPSDLARQATSLDTNAGENSRFFEKSGVALGALVISSALVYSAYLMWQDGKGGYKPNGRRSKYRRNPASIPMFWVGSGKKRDKKWVAV